MNAQAAINSSELELSVLADDEVKDEAVFLIGPPGQLRKALENKRYPNVDVFDKGDLVVAEFDCMPGDPETQWFLENAGKNCRLYLLGCSFLHRAAGLSARITARFSYDEDSTTKRDSKPRVR